MAASTLYDTVTASIVESLERGVKPWEKPWNDTGVPNLSMPLRVTGERYTGMNVLILWDASQRKGYRGRTWMTFNQALELKGAVRKGEKATYIAYFSSFAKEREDGATVKIPFLKTYAVFNTDQIDNLPAKFYPAPVSDVAPVIGLERIEVAESFAAATGAVVKHGLGRAFYSPSADYVGMPDFETFVNSHGYYSTLFHELSHWTGHESRNDRKLSNSKRFGDAAYAFEELIAELGAAFVCADLGISLQPRPDHASYIGSWVKALKNDHKAIFSAASAAEKAVGYLQGKRAAVANDQCEVATA